VVGEREEPNLNPECALIVNPVSGGYSEAVLQRIVSGLQERGFAPTVLPTRGPADAARHAGEWCAGRKDPLVIVAGGDGTLNGAANGLRPGEARLAVVPVGTSNVLARELGIGSIGEALEKIVEGKTKSLTAGLVRGEAWRRYFLLMAGIGFDGAVVESVRLPEKKIFKQGAYLLSACRLLRQWETAMLEVAMEDVRTACHTVVVCNAARYGGSFLLAPEADLFSPEFQVVCFGDDRRRSLLGGIIRVLTGKAVSQGDIRIVPAARLAISGRKPVQIDGDFFGYSPVKISAVEDFVRVVV
jgi:diacylglycerol kinase (ATP)